MKAQGMVVLAAVAHPDDVEFLMAGTLLLLKDAGAEIHMWNLANGCLGSVRHDAAETARVRQEEARASARLAGVVLHEPLFDDLAIFYDAESLARVAAVVREVKPTVLLTHSPADYMEDHQNACRLAVSACFARRVPNYRTSPERSPVEREMAIYHGMPQGLMGPLREPVTPHFYVDTTSVQERKRAMLACHRSQKEWLDVSQGFDSYLQIMKDLGREVGRWTGVCPYAEGWRYRNPLGLCAVEADPLARLLAGCRYQPASA
jgi:LmbE family N-acetylglucosaminyl deacetylase